MVIAESALFALAGALSPKAAKEIVELAEKLDQLLGKLSKTRTGKKAAEKALIILLAGGKETDPEFLKLVAQVEETGVNTPAARLVRDAVKKTAYKKPAAKKPAAKKSVAKKAAAKRSAAKKPAVKKASATKA